MGWLGIASILSCVVILLDGPLLQRSSTVVTASHQGPTVSLDFTMVPELPTGKSYVLDLDQHEPDRSRTGLRKPSLEVSGSVNNILFQVTRENGITTQ